MPARHRYKCLNPDCPSMTDAAKDMTFVALNMPQPTCPHCAAIRLEDWGEAVNIMGGVSPATKSNDAGLRALAGRHGLTDMSNRGGKAVKSTSSPTAAGSEPTVNVGGAAVPMSVAASAGCVNMPSMARKLTPPTGSANVTQGPKIGAMTRVVGEHKAGA